MPTVVMLNEIMMVPAEVAQWQNNQLIIPNLRLLIKPPLVQEAERVKQGRLIEGGGLIQLTSLC